MWYQFSGNNPVVSAGETIPTEKSVPVIDSTSTQKKVYLEFFQGLSGFLNDSENKLFVDHMLSDLNGKMNTLQYTLQPVLSNEQFSPPVVIDQPGRWSRIRFNDTLSGKLEKDKQFYLVKINGNICTYQQLYEHLQLPTVASVSYQLS